MAASDAVPDKSNLKASLRTERGPASEHATENQSSPPLRSDSRSPNQRIAAAASSAEIAAEDSEGGRNDERHSAAARSLEEEAEEGTSRSQPDDGHDDGSLPADDGEEPPPLPVGEEPPPLPNEPPPDDGWEAMWDDANQAYYFFNRLTGVTQWENPRVPDGGGGGGGNDEQKEANDHEHDPSEAKNATSTAARPHGGYNPAIHGDYDPNADYAVAARAQEDARNNTMSSSSSSLLPGGSGLVEPGAEYAATGQFNRFTGRWQAAEQGPDRHNDESKSRRQMGAYFDVDAAANSHGGRSLKAERQGKKLSKAELRAFKEKRRERKEEKRRAWLRD